MPALELDGALGLQSWRWLFVGQGGATIVAGILMLFLLPESPATARWLSAAHQLAMGHAERRVASDSSAAQFGHRLLEVLRRPLTWALSLMWFTLCLMKYVSVFFLPLLISRLLPTLPLCNVMLLVGGVESVSLVASPLLAKHADRGGAPRRLALIFAVLGVCTSLLILMGAALLFAATEPLAAPFRAMVSQLAVVGFAIQSIASSCMPGVFFALHHAATPARLHSLSIPAVNSLGLLGGFVGPWMIGALHDRLGPPCPPAASRCITDRGWGCLVLGLTSLALALAAYTAARALGVHHRGGRYNVEGISASRHGGGGGHGGGMPRSAGASEDCMELNLRE